MNKVVFSGHGIDIVHRANRFFIQYDAGELVSDNVEVEITESEAEKARRSEWDAYEVLRLSSVSGGILRARKLY